MNRIRITPLTVPTSLDAADADEFRTMVELSNRMARLDAGIDDLDDDPEQILPSWLDQTDRRSHGFVARRDERILGVATVRTSMAEHTTTADLEFAVLPEQIRDGVGQLLLDRVEAEAASLGRTVLQTWSLHPAVGTGTGRILRPQTLRGQAEATAFTDLLESNGYTLEQVERNSALPLHGSLDAVRERHAQAWAAAGADYRLETWTLPTPEHLQAGYGAVIARMATDVPAGDLEMTPEVWDEAKVRRRDAQFVAGGQTMSVAAVIHISTGEMVAFNELQIGQDTTGVTHQWGTLVVPEHRGRRLGTLVKCASGRSTAIFIFITSYE